VIEINLKTIDFFAATVRKHLKLVDVSIVLKIVL